MGRRPKEILTQFQKEIVYTDITFGTIKEKLNHFNEQGKDGKYAHIENISFNMTKTTFYRKLGEIKRKRELYQQARKEMSYIRILWIVNRIDIINEILDSLVPQPTSSYSFQGANKVMSDFRKYMKLCNEGVMLQQELQSYR